MLNIDKSEKNSFSNLQTYIYDLDNRTGLKP